MFVHLWQMIDLLHRACSFLWQSHLIVFIHVECIPLWASLLLLQQTSKGPGVYSSMACWTLTSCCHPPCQHHIDSQLPSTWTGVVHISITWSQHWQYSTPVQYFNCHVLCSTTTLNILQLLIHRDNYCIIISHNATHREASTPDTCSLTQQ